jgi:16S rRNA (guanine966-N2)-methyltransferase
VRIISGSCKGKKLYSVPGWNTRPTSGRIKESIFNILSWIKPDTVVLDLFAGTGALAIEALSRGASYAVLIDNAHIATKTIKRNLMSCGLANRAKIYNWDVQVNLNCLIKSQIYFNLVFMDPPYQSNVIAKTIDNIICTNTLTNNAIIIIEHSVKEPLINLPNQLSIKDERRYGKTLVSFLTYML